MKANIDLIQHMLNRFPVFSYKNDEGITIFVDARDTFQPLVNEVVTMRESHRQICPDCGANHEGVTYTTVIHECTECGTMLETNLYDEDNTAEGEGEE